MKRRGTDRMRIAGWLAALLGLAALSLVAGRLAPRTARQDVPPPVADRAATAPEALAAAGPLGALQQPSPPVAPTCRTVAGPLVVDAEDENTAWARIENSGAVTATLAALELGWSGDQPLAAVVARSGAGEAEQSLFTGERESPALVLLEGQDRAIAPGEALEIGLRVAPGVPGEPWAPRSAILYLAEGCRAALLPVTPSRCPIALSPPAPSLDAERRVDVELRATGATTEVVTALEISWPVEDNGALVGLTLDEEPLAAFDAAEMGYSPATLDLRRLLGFGIVLPPGPSRTLGLEFERPAAAAPYVVTAASGIDCAATSTTWVAAPDCGLLLDDLRALGPTVSARLMNPRRVPRSLVRLDLYWPEANGALTAVELDGRPLWTGEIARPPAALTVERGVRIADRSTYELTLRFGTEGAETPEPPAIVSPTEGSYTIIASLDGGCRALLSTTEQAEACRLSASDPVSVEDGQALSIAVTNGGLGARLAALGLEWDPAKGDLQSLRFGDDEMLSAPVAGEAQPLTLTLPAESGPLLARGERRALRLAFDGPAPVAPEGLRLSLDFESTEGPDCAPLWIHVPSAPPADCPYALDELALQDRLVRARLAHEGGPDRPGEAELRWLRLSWPVELSLPDLVEVSVQHEGEDPVRVWSGRAARPGTELRLLPGAATGLAAGEVITLHLRFDERLDGSGASAESFRLEAGFADDCVATVAGEASEPPAQVSFSGVIESLPDPLLRCCWRIQRLGESGRLETVDLEATDRTALEPAGARPRPGDAVSVLALRYPDDGRLVAERIKIVQPDRHARLVGSVQEIGPLAPGGDRPSYIRVLDRRVLLDEATAIEGRLQEQAYVVVEGEARPDGSVLAAVIRAAGANTVPEYIFELKGVVQRVAEVSACEFVWVVDHYRLHVERAALPPEMPCTQPSLGSLVRFSGWLQPGGAESDLQLVEADEVTVLSTRAERAAVTREVSGQLVSRPESGYLGTWEILPDRVGMPERIEVRSAAVVDTRRAPADPGPAIRVRARVQRDPGGAWVALRLRTDWAD